MPERGRSFGPTVLLGLAGAALASVAGARTWATASGSAAGVHVRAGVTGSQSAPLVVALALVTLAAWGVVLVVRGRVRRAAALLGVVASVGVLVATAAAFGRATSDAAGAVVAKGATSDVQGSLTAWYYAAAVGAVTTLAAFAVAVVVSTRWPAMGSRYDAPAARAAAPQGRAVNESDLWRALDDGRDPTE